MTEVRQQENAIVLAAAERLVSLGNEASQQLVAGKESTKNTKKGNSIITLFEAYAHKSDFTDYEIDALLYCLRSMSDQESFPTTSPIVGKELNVQTIIAGSDIKVYNQGVLLGVANEIDFEDGLVASLIGSKVTVTDSDSGSGIVTLKRTLNVDEILHLNSSPIELIPAPGAGKIIVPHQILVYLNYQSIPYDSFTNVGLWYNNIAPIGTSDILSQIDTSFSLIPASNSGGSYDILNKPITVNTNGGNPANGKSTLTIYISYFIL